MTISKSVAPPGLQAGPAAPRRPSYVMNGLSRLGGLVPLALVTMLTVVPVGFLVYGALRTSAPGLPGSWTLQNFRFLGSATFLGFAKNTIVIALEATVLGFLIGLVLAIAVVRFDVPGGRLLDALIVVPAFIPQFIMAIAWISLMDPRVGYLNTALGHVGIGPLNIYSTAGIVWVMALCAAPVAYLYIRPGLLAVDAGLEEAAWVFGASRMRTLLRVVLRICAPTLLSSALVVLVTSIGEFGIPGVLGPQAHIDTISTALLEMVTESPSDPNTAAVLGLTLLAVCLICLLINRRILKGGNFVTIGGRGSGQKKSGGKYSRFIALVPCVLFILLAVILPLAALLIGSLQPYLSPTFQAGWTLANYKSLLTYPSAMSSIWNSILLSVLAAVIGMLLSVALARIVVRHRGLTAKFVDYAATLPLAVPQVVFGLALLWMWVQIPIGLYGTKWILLVAFIGLMLPYGVRACVAAFQQIDPALEEAGRVGGANLLRVTRTVVLPLLAPALLSGGTIILYHSMREVSAALMLYTPGNEVMSIEIWNAYGAGTYTALFALAIVNIALILIIVSLGNVGTQLLAGRGQRDSGLPSQVTPMESANSLTAMGGGVSGSTYRS